MGVRISKGEVISQTIQRLSSALASIYRNDLLAAMNTFQTQANLLDALNINGDFSWACVTSCVSWQKGAKLRPCDGNRAEMRFVI